MKAISLEAPFLGEEAKGSSSRRMPAEQTLRRMEFNTAYDTMRRVTRERLEKGDAEGAIKLHTDALGDITAFADEEPLDLIRAARMQILTAMLIETDNLKEARITAARLLAAMAHQAKRKDEPFLQLLGALLYDIAVLHASRSEFRQAERELEKALKLFERLARTKPDRYGPAHIMAQRAATDIYRSRAKQVETLANYQATTQEILKQVDSGIEDAALRLVDSLHTEGRTLASMGRHREAIQYLSRAIKYQGKLVPQFDLKQLAMSIDLGEALLNVPVTRDKGIHLLNTMLHKAVKINAEEEHRHIVDILLNAKTRSLDILSLWHKMFPR